MWGDKKWEDSKVILKTSTLLYKSILKEKNVNDLRMMSRKPSSQKGDRLRQK